MAEFYRQNKVISIIYYLEDLAQRDFITRLVDLISEPFPVEIYHNEDDSRNKGGKGKAISGFKDCIRTWKRSIEQNDIVIVCIDGNCSKFNNVRKNIKDIAERAGYPGLFVAAVPGPHIEKWYCLAMGKPGKGKCQKDFYKEQGKKLVKEKYGYEPFISISEFSEEILSNLNIERMMSGDSSFKAFVTDLRDALTRFK